MVWGAEFGFGLIQKQGFWGQGLALGHFGPKWAQNTPMQGYWSYGPPPPPKDGPVLVTQPRPGQAGRPFGGKIGP